MAFSLRNDSHSVATHSVKDLNHRAVTNGVNSKEPKSYLTISSVAKAAFVAIGTIGGYYLVKTTNILSYFGLGSKNPKDVNNREIVKVENGKQPLILRSDLEEVEQTGNFFRARRSNDDILEFKEVIVEEFENLPEVERRERTRRSITIQNPISDQTATVENLFELTINGSTIFDSNTIFINATNIPTWMTSLSLNPTLIGSYDTPDQANGIVLSGNYAYVADMLSGLQIIDISNPANPTFKGSYNTPSFANGIAISGNYAYVADYASGLQIIDISNPANPTFIGSYDTPIQAMEIALSGNYAYVADWDSGLQIINITDPANPTFVSSYDTPNSAKNLAISGNYTYVADYLSGLQIIDISNPANPTFKGSYITSSLTNDVAISGNYAYVANWSSGLQIIDISNPANLTFIGSYDTPGSAIDVVLSGNYAYVTSGGLVLQIIDITDPANPTFKGSYDTPCYSVGIPISGNYAYMTCGSMGLQIIETNLDKLTLSGTPNSIGTYSVDIRGCNEINECIIDSFNVIVTDPNPPTNPPPSSTTAIIASSIAGTVCAIGLFGLSIIGVTVAVIRHRRKKMKEHQIVEIASENQSVVKDTLQPVIQQQNLEIFPEVYVEYDLNAKGEKVPTAPNYENDVELDTVPDFIEGEPSANLKIASVPELSETSDEIEYDKATPENFIGPISQEIMKNPYMLAATGQTYEKRQIMTWLAENDTDPLTRERLTSIQITPNIALRGLIEKWQEKHKINV